MRQTRHSQDDASPSPSGSKVAHEPATDTTIKFEAEESFDASVAQDVISFSVLCLHDFESREAGLLSFRKNEILDVIRRDESGWWAAMRPDGPNGPVVGWIPHAYVSILSEERANQLRGKERQSRERAEQPGLVASHFVIADDTRTSSPGTESFSFPSVYDSTDRLVHDENRNPYSSDSDVARPKPSTSSVIPPSRSASFKKNWQPHTSFPDNTRPRAGSLTPGRSARRQIIHSNEPLSRLSNLETTKPRELTRMPSSGFTGTIESLYKRLGDDKTQRRKPSEDTPLPQQPRPTYSQKPQYEVDEDDKGHIRSGTLLALVERLTLEALDSAKSKSFVNVFLMTFRTFTTANILFNVLVERFHTPPPTNLTDPDIIDWNIHVRHPLRLRVLKVFNAWLEEHRLLEEEPYIAGRLTDFLKTIDDSTLRGIIETILETIQRLTFTIPNKPSTTVSAKKARKSKAYKNELSKMDPTDVAEQLTLLEFSFYVKINPQECLAYAKTQSGNSVANLIEFCSTHDKLGSWVKTSVLNYDALSKRSDMIDFWIKVAEKCRSLSNFSSMSSIITALSSTVLTQLHMTWSHVGRKSNLDALLRHNEPTGGFAGYRSLVQQAEGPCVPFITMYLTDIMHVGQHSKQETDIIFFFQRARWYEIITNMLKFQTRPYRIAPSDTTTQFIEARLREALRDEDWFWQRSKELQQAEAAHADIRKGLEAAGF